MNRIHDQPLARTCAKGTLWRRLARTGGLVMGAALASLLLVDLPIPTGRTTSAPPYVPAAETWIEPGATHAGSRSERPSWMPRGSGDAGLAGQSGQRGQTPFDDAAGGDKHRQKRV